MLKIKKKMMQYTLSSYIVKLWATSTLEKCKGRALGLSLESDL